MRDRRVTLTVVVPPDYFGSKKDGNLEEDIPPWRVAHAAIDFWRRSLGGTRSSEREWRATVEVGGRRVEDWGRAEL